MDYSSKENLIPKNKEGPVIPNLRLRNTGLDSMSPVNYSSYSSRVKKRNQVHRSLDLCKIRCSIKTPSIIKGNHDIVPPLHPLPTTTRKRNLESCVLIKNRNVSRNIFLDQLPL